MSQTQPQQVKPSVDSFLTWPFWCGLGPGSETSIARPVDLIFWELDSRGREHTLTTFKSKIKLIQGSMGAPCGCKPLHIRCRTYDRTQASHVLASQLCLTA